jgi:hypothetical protein
VSDTGSQYLSSPQRAYDSRNVPAGKLQAGDGDTTAPRTIPIAGVVPGVPAAARAVFGNLTVTQAEAGSFATIWPDGPWPGTSSINFQPATDLANAFNVGLSSTGSVKIAAFRPTHVIIDIAGYVL